VVASRYASALLRVVLEKKEDPERIDRELGEMGALLEEHAGLSQALASPAVVSSRRVAIVDGLLARSKLSRTISNLLRVMAAKKRMAILGLVQEAYRRHLDEHQKVETAEVVTSHALSTGKTVRAEFRTDPELVGGLIVRIGNRIYDASVTAQLARVKERLLSTY
jgi:F-type H+-transporting ATPase subunit delta